MKHNHILWRDFITHLEEQGVELCQSDHPPPGMNVRVPYLRRPVEGHVPYVSHLPKTYDPDGWANVLTVDAICRRLKVQMPYIKLVL